MLDAGERLSSYEPLWENWYKDEFIGGGSFGRVYRFKQNFFGEIRYSAVKMIPIIIDQGINNLGGNSAAYIEKKKAAMVGEIKNMYKLEGKPNLVQCLAHSIRDIYDDYGSIIGFDILIQMHLYTPLTAYMRRNVIMTENQVSCLAFQIGNALESMHNIGMLHRDVKVDNIYVDDQGSYLLGDFGISKQDALGSGSTMAGTQPFIAPEVWNINITNVRYTKTADIYSFGITLYYLLNNNMLPLVKSGMSHNEIDQAIFDRLGGKRFDPPANGSARLKDIVMKCCEYEPERRFQSIGEVIMALSDPTYEFNYIPDTGDTNAAFYAYHEDTAVRQDMNAAYASQFAQTNDPYSTTYADYNSYQQQQQAIINDQPLPIGAYDTPVYDQGQNARKKNHVALIVGAVAAFALCAFLTIFLLTSTSKDDEIKTEQGTTESSSEEETAATTSKTTAATTTTTTERTTAKPAETTTTAEPERPAGRVNTAELRGEESTEKSKNTIKIMCWNTEFRSRLGSIYPKFSKYPVQTGKFKDDYDREYADVVSIDGKRIEWIIVDNAGASYQNALVKVLNAQHDSDDKLDMFLVEADYALNFIDSGEDRSRLCTLSIQDLGITDNDTKNMYKYTLDAVRDPVSGDIKGVSWQATPGLFLYDVKIAREVLGTDDPAKVQQFVKDWDSFKETARKMKSKGYYMLSSACDTYRVFASNMSSPWVVSGSIQVDPQMKAWADQAKEFYDNRWCNGTNQWTDAWESDMKNGSKVFGFFMPSWGIDNCLYRNGGTESTGKWKACPGPAGWYWGGSWICGAIDSDNQDIIADIMKVMACNKDASVEFINKFGEMPNNKEAVASVSSTYKNSYLGGQNHLALLSQSADKINLSSKMSKYDQICVENFQSAMNAYFTGESSYDSCIRTFKNNVRESYPELTG